MRAVRRPGLLPVLAILAAVLIRATYAVAALPTAQAKAAHCCRTHCGHGQCPPEHDRCCQVTSHAGDPATVGPTVLPNSPVSTSVALVGALRRGNPGQVISLARLDEVHPGGPPTFLMLRSLRL